MAKQRTVINFVDCHRLPERSFFWKGKQFPVCARCTGIYVGYISIIFFTLSIWSLPIWISLLLMLPTIIDGLTQAYWDRESNNPLRFITGTLAGIGAMAFIATVGQYIGVKIVSLFI